MADDSKQSGSGPGMGGNAFIWVVLAAIGAAIVNPPNALQNLRPHQDGSQIDLARQEQDIDARLWQDPFTAVANEAGDRYGLKRGPRDLGQQARSRPTRDECENRLAKVDLHLCSPVRETGGDTDIIGIMVPGGPYSEDTESRRRIRYAVLAALRVQHYVPVNSEHIGFFLPPDDPPLLLNADEAPANWRLPQFIPYEFLDTQQESGAQPAPSRRILLLWLNDDGFSFHPLDKLARLACFVRPQGWDDMTFKIIGPQDSDTLLAMIENLGPASADDPAAGREADNARAATETWVPCGVGGIRGLQDPVFDARRRILTGTEIFNSSATVAPAELCIRLPKTLAGENCSDPVKAIENAFGKNGIAFWQTIASDDVLSLALGKELEKWNVDRGPPWLAQLFGGDEPGGVALVSEWDTYYGQSLPNTLTSKLNLSRESDCKAASNKTTSAAPQRWTKRYSYLRGIDGQLPDQPDEHASQPAADAQPSSQLASRGPRASDVTNLSQSAEGQGQGDYLRRLAAHLREDDRRCREAGAGGIRAIGILGSDLYDKLLVLRALKDEIPDAVFFTTDLDARLLHPTQEIPTRGLIVASSFGLRLADPLQHDIPPFRGVYQTAAFLATLLATQPRPKDGPPPPDMVQKIADSVQIFEIGRTDALRLSDASPSTVQDPPSPACLPSDRTIKYLGCNPLHPPLEAASSAWQGDISWHIAGVTLLTSIGVYAFVVLLVLLYRGMDWVRAKAKIIMISFFAVLVLAYHFYGAAPELVKILSKDGQGDLLTWFEGISLWPATAIRSVSFLLSVGFIFYVKRRLHDNFKEISYEIGLDEMWRQIKKAQNKPAHRTSCRTVFKNANPFFIREKNDIEPPQPAPVANLGQQQKQEQDWQDACAANFWKRYIDHRSGSSQWYLVTLSIVGIVLLLIALSLAFGETRIPHRGTASFVAFWIVTSLDFLATQCLIFYVADATLFSWLFVKEAFGSARSANIWPQKAKALFAANVGMGGDKITDTLNLLYVARRTDCITGLIYYPFLMIAFMVLSRSPWFGAFSPDPTVLASQLVSLVIVFISVMALRFAAEDARKKVSAKLTQQLLLARGNIQQSGQGAQLELLLDRIASYREGAFSPLSQQPVIRALLLPLATYGGPAALQYLTSANF